MKLYYAIESGGIWHECTSSYYRSYYKVKDGKCSVCNFIIPGIYLLGVKSYFGDSIDLIYTEQNAYEPSLNKLNSIYTLIEL